MRTANAPTTSLLTDDCDGPGTDRTDNACADEPAPATPTVRVSKWASVARLLGMPNVVSPEEAARTAAETAAAGGAPGSDAGGGAEGSATMRAVADKLTGLASLTIEVWAEEAAYALLREYWGINDGGGDVATRGKAMKAANREHLAILDSLVDRFISLGADDQLVALTSLNVKLEAIKEARLAAQPAPDSPEAMIAQLTATVTAGVMAGVKRTLNERLGGIETRLTAGETERAAAAEEREAIGRTAPAPASTTPAPAQPAARTNGAGAHGGLFSGVIRDATGL